MSQAVNDTRMSWREAGTGDAVVFLHGFPFNSSMWQAQLDDVPPGWRFIAPDLRGFGASEAPGSGALTMETFAKDVVALLDHLEVEQAVICGQSMGGYVGFALAFGHSDRVRALVPV